MPTDSAPPIEGAGLLRTTGHDYDIPWCDAFSVYEVVQHVSQRIGITIVGCY